MKLAVWLTLFVLLASTVSAVSIEIFNSNLEEKQIFSPGSEIIFKADADADTATLVIMKGSEIVVTERMKILSEEPKQFAYLYEIPENQEHGDYKAKVMAKGESAEQEFYVGIEIKGELMSSSEVAKIRGQQASLWQRLFKFLLESFIRGFTLGKV